MISIASYSYFRAFASIVYHQVNLPKGFGYVEFKTRADAEKAQRHMDGVSITVSMSSVLFASVPHISSMFAGSNRWSSCVSPVRFDSPTGSSPESSATSCAQ